MTKRRRFRGWQWLFPISQLIHAAEELVEGHGFHGWLRSLRHAESSPWHVLLLHAAFAAAMLVVVFVTVRKPQAQWLLVTLSVLVLLNALAHSLGAVMSRGRTSGLLSALLIWLPLGVAGLVSGWRDLPRRLFWLGVMTGIIVQVPVSWLALSAGPVDAVASRKSNLSLQRIPTRNLMERTSAQRLKRLVRSELAR